MVIEHRAYVAIGCGIAITNLSVSRDDIRTAHSSSIVEAGLSHQGASLDLSQDQVTHLDHYVQTADDPQRDHTALPNNDEGSVSLDDNGWHVPNAVAYEL